MIEQDGAGWRIMWWWPCSGLEKPLVCVERAGRYVVTCVGAGDSLAQALERVAEVFANRWRLP